MTKIKTKRKKRKDKTRYKYRKTKKTIKKLIGGGEGKEFWDEFFEENPEIDFDDLEKGNNCACGSGIKFKKCNNFNDGKCIKLAEKAHKKREKEKSTSSKRLTTRSGSARRAAAKKEYDESVSYSARRAVAEKVYDESIPGADGILKSEAGAIIESILKTMGEDLAVPISFGISTIKGMHERQLKRLSESDSRGDGGVQITDLDIVFIMFGQAELFEDQRKAIDKKVMHSEQYHLMGRSGVLIALHDAWPGHEPLRDLAEAAEMVGEREIKIFLSDPEYEILGYILAFLPAALERNPRLADRREITKFIQEASAYGRANIELGIDALSSLNGGIKYKSIPTIIVFNYLLSKFLYKKWKEQNIELLAELIQMYRRINPGWITGKHKFEYLTMYFLRNAGIWDRKEVFVQYFKNRRPGSLAHRVYMEEYGETTQQLYGEKKRLTLTQKIYDLGFCSSENRLFEINSAIVKYNETLIKLYNTRDFEEEDLKSIIKEYEEKLTDSLRCDHVLDGRLKTWFESTEEELDRSRTDKYAFLDDEIDIISVIWEQSNAENIVDNLFNELYILHRKKYGDDINGYLDRLDKRTLISEIMEIKKLYLRCLKLLREFHPRTIVVCKDLRTYVRVTGERVISEIDQLSLWGKDVHSLDYQNLGWIKLVLENNDEYNEVLSEDRRILIEHSMDYLINQLEVVYKTTDMEIKDFETKIRSFMGNPESTERVELLFQYIEKNEELDGRPISLKTKYDIADFIIKRRQLESRRSLRDRFSSVLDRGTSVESTGSTETVDSDGSFDHGDEEDQGERDVQAQQRREEAERLRAIELRDRFRNKYIDSSSSTFYDPEADPDPYDSLLEIDPLKYQVLDRFSGSEREQYIKKLACAAYTGEDSKRNREEDMMDPVNRLKIRSTIKDNISDLISEYGVDIVKSIIDNCSKNIKKRQKNFLRAILSNFKRGYQTTIMEEIIRKLFERFSMGPDNDPSRRENSDLLWSVDDLEDLVGKESERNLVPRQDFNKIITDILNNNVHFIDTSEFPGTYVRGEIGGAIYIGSTGDDQIVRHLYEMYVNEKVLERYHIDEEQEAVLRRIDEEQEAVAELRSLSRGQLTKRALREGVDQDEITVLSQRRLSSDRERDAIITLILEAREREREDDLDEI